MDFYKDTILYKIIDTCMRVAWDIAGGDVGRPRYKELRNVSR